MTRDQTIAAAVAAIVNAQAISGLHPAGQAPMTVQDMVVALVEFGVLKVDAGVPDPPPPPTITEEFSVILHRYYGIPFQTAATDTRSILTELQKAGIKIGRTNDQE